MIEINVAPMSDSAYDILIPPRQEPEIDTGYLAGFIRRLATALDGAAAGALDDWAWNAIHNYPSTPTKEEVAEQFPTFTLPMPEWDL